MPYEDEEVSQFYSIGPCVCGTDAWMRRGGYGGMPVSYACFSCRREIYPTG